MALVPDQKFSTFQDGGDIESGDIIVGLRDGLNTRFNYTGELPVGVIIPILNGGTGADNAPDARTNLGLGSMAVQNSNAVSISGGTLTDVSLTASTAALLSGSVVAAPVAGSDLVNKTYADSIAAGFHFVTPVRVASTVAFTATYANGSSGVGATLTATSNGAASIDSVSLALNDRVLFKNQASTFQNGVYRVFQVGDGSTPAIYMRTTDFDQPSEIVPGDLVPVLEGTVNALTMWIQTAVVAVIGTDAITFVQFGTAFSNVVTISGTQTITGAKTFLEPLDVINAASIFGNTRADGANKTFRFQLPNYNNADGFVGGLILSNTLTQNNVYLGGSSVTANAATQVSIFAAANTTTPTGTTIANFNINGMQLMSGSSRVDKVLNEDDMVSDSDTALATQQSIKAYVDSLGGALQVVQAVKSGPQTIASTSQTDITGLSLVITPSSATSRILLISTVTMGSVSQTADYVLNSSISGNIFIGGAAGGRARLSTGGGNESAASASAVSINYLDSPATTSPITYKIAARGRSATAFYINRTATDTNASDYSRYASSLIALEIKQ